MMDRRTIRGRRTLMARQYIRLREGMAQCQSIMQERDCCHCRSRDHCQLHRQYEEANRTLTAMNRG